jgi:hypothetical protein
MPLKLRRAGRGWMRKIWALRPQIIICLGATAAQALLGRDFRVSQHRGDLLKSPLAPVLMATVHPSSILRAPDKETSAVHTPRKLPPPKSTRSCQNHVLLAHLLAGSPSPYKTTRLHSVGGGFEDLQSERYGVAKNHTKQRGWRRGWDSNPRGFADPFETLSTLFPRAIPPVS